MSAFGGLKRVTGDVVSHCENSHFDAFLTSTVTTAAATTAESQAQVIKITTISTISYWLPSEGDVGPWPHKTTQVGGGEESLQEVITTVEVVDYHHALLVKCGGSRVKSGDAYYHLTTTTPLIHGFINHLIV